ncbi:MAG TPA: helicase, partial [Verrucomicrobiales bacterium]|nr:helicase [Verrucomicrobiales bacterium]
GAVKALRADFTVVMTGTPVENTLRDFWCLMDRVAPGYLNNYQPFRQEFIAPILQAKRSGDAAAQVRIRNEIGERLRERVGGLMLRRLKEDHLKDLPNKEVILHKDPSDSHSGFDERILCEMSGEQKQLYDGICSQECGDEESDRSDRGKSILGAIQNLRAVSLHPDLVLKDSLPCPKKAKDADAYLRQSAKLSLLLEILNQISERREKVLIFVINKNLQALLRSALQLIYRFESPIEVINGDTNVATSSRSKSKSRTELIDEFSEQEGFRILILSPLAAGVGLTITEANHVIHLERHWNPAKEAQATDRVYRIGQKKPVSVWIPILTHPDRKSFDVNLNQLLSMKSRLSDAVVTPEVVSHHELKELLDGFDPSDDD